MQISQSLSVLPVASFFPGSSWIFLSDSKKYGDESNKSSFESTLRSLTSPKENQFFLLQSLFVAAINERSDEKTAIESLEFMIMTLVGGKTESHEIAILNLLFCSQLCKMKQQNFLARETNKNDNQNQRNVTFTVLEKKMHPLWSINNNIAQEDKAFFSSLRSIFFAENAICRKQFQQAEKELTMCINPEDEEIDVAEKWRLFLELVVKYCGQSNAIVTSEEFCKTVMEMITQQDPTKSKNSENIISKIETEIHYRMSLILFEVDAMEHLMKSFLPGPKSFSSATAKLVSVRSQAVAVTTTTATKSASDDVNTLRLSIRVIRSQFGVILNDCEDTEETFAKSLQDIEILAKKLATIIDVAKSKVTNENRKAENGNGRDCFQIEYNLVVVEALEALGLVTLMMVNRRYIFSSRNCDKRKQSEDSKTDNSSPESACLEFITLPTTSVEHVVNIHLQKLFRQCFALRSNLTGSLKKYKPVMLLILERFRLSLTKIFDDNDQKERDENQNNTSSFADFIKMNFLSNSDSPTSLLEICIDTQDFDERLKMREMFCEFVSVRGEGKLVLRSQQDEETKLVQLKELLRKRVGHTNDDTDIKCVEAKAFLNALGEF